MNFLKHTLLITLLVLTIYLRIENYIITSAKPRLNLYEAQSPNAILTSSKAGSYLSADNVSFRFKENIILLLKNVNAEILPVQPLKVINLDDVNAFLINVSKADVFIASSTLKVIMKDNIFNYPGSPLKIKELEFPNPNSNEIKLSGSLNFVIWLEFELLGKISLDEKKERIVITAEQITALGNPYAKSLLSAVGLNLEKLLPVPEGRGIRIKANQIFVEPFSIFPPPRLSGTLQDLTIENGKLHLNLDNGKSVLVPTMPYPASKNFLYFFTGDLKFAKLFMVESSLQIYDKDESDPFDFFMDKYLLVLAKAGVVTLSEDRSVKVVMPDYDDVFK
jgi:hypothetical protein